MRRIITTALVALIAAQLYPEANIAAERPSYRAVKVNAPFPMRPREVNNFREVLLSPNGADLAPSIWRPSSDTAIPITVVDTPYNTFFALDINDKGYVCGDARKIDFFDKINDAFITNPFFTVLDNVPSGVVSPCSPPIFEGFTIALNNRSDVAGTVRADSCRLQACVWMAGSGKPVRVGILQDYRESRATAINNTGVITFDATVRRPANIASNRAYVWQNGAPTELPAIDGNPQSSSWSLEINDNGWIVGRSINQIQGGASDTRPTLWRNGTPTDLLGDSIPVGSAFGIASAINNAGMITISGGRGMLWHDDSLWTLNDLIVNILYDDGTVVPNIQAPISINDMGDILTSEGALLIRQPKGVVVNSTGDSPDNNLGDGRCYTGGVNSIGDDECTLRAAIQHANATPGVDTIVFNIPASGTPRINVLSALPPITERVVIDGRTQGSSQIVEVSGASAGLAREPGAAVDGLVVSADSCSILALIINGFSGNGITLGAPGGNTIESCIIGTNQSGDSTLGNAGHGIFIQNSSDNTIGSPVVTEKNRIAFNGSAGVFVQSGSRNKITSNSIHSNGALGIDLAASGVNANDSTDSDTGPNDLANYPVIDSFKTASGQLDVFGSLLGKPTEPSYTIEVFRNDECDSSGFGEGQDLLGSVVVIPNAISGIAAFQLSVTDTLGEKQLLTATATDDQGNTSEFAKCAVKRKVLFLNGFKLPIRNTDLILYKVANDPPNFTESLIDTLRTDSSGFILLDSLGLSVGDSLKAFQRLTSFPAVKHMALLGTKFSILIDNAHIDSLGRVSFHEMSDSAIQTVIMDHSTFTYNLVVSIDWDASTSYLQGTEQGFRNMSNYLYDVTDGQMRLDTVLIYDDKLHWNSADITVYADNTIWPHVDEVLGINRPTGEKSDPVEMPRKWFGSPAMTYNSSFSENPLQMSAAIDFRTRAHELGHYAFGFEDEYRFKSGVRCASHPLTSPTPNPYGFMDSQYQSAEPHSSEMSADTAYANSACRNNLHWAKYAKSCWRVFESLHEGAWGHPALVATVFRPEERVLASGFDHIPGPNNNLSALNQDVGKLVIFPNPVTAPATRTVAITINSLQTGLPLGGAKSVLRKVAQNRTIIQGKADVLGRMRVLGAESGDAILASGRVRKDSVTFRGAVPDGWMSGEAIVGGAGISRYNNEYVSPMDDSMTLSLKPISGAFPLNIYLTPNPAGIELEADAQNLLPQLPSLESVTESGVSANATVTLNNSTYHASLNGDLEGSGSITFTAIDDSAKPFFLTTYYALENFSPGEELSIKSPSGSSEALLDPLNGALERTVILSSPYPVIRNGIDPGASQAGDAHALGFYPAGTLSGDNPLIIRYADSDLIGVPAEYSDESTLRAFVWNDSSFVWQVVGGSVDTVFNEVTVSIDEPGLYALFTTNLASSCCDKPGDANNDGSVNIADITFVVAWLFNGGPDPVCFAEADATADTKLNIQDVTYMIAWLFNGGPDPVCGE